MSELSCMVAVKRNVTNGGRRPFSPSLATVAACFDRSGSIVSMGDTPQKALVAFITDRKQDAKDKNIEMKISITIFDDKVERIFTDMRIENVQMTEAEARIHMKPRGMTRLFATAIEELASIRKRFKKLKDSNVVPLKKVTATFLLFTDGCDNESHPLTSHDLNVAVRAARAEGITCIFAGAAQDAIASGGQYGFDKLTCLTMTPTSRGAAAGLRSCSQAMGRAVSGNNAQFTQQERQTSMEYDTSPSSSPNNSLHDASLTCYSNCTPRTLLGAPPLTPLFRQTATPFQIPLDFMQDVLWDYDVDSDTDAAPA